MAMRDHEILSQIPNLRDTLSHFAPDGGINHVQATTFGRGIREQLNSIKAAYKPVLVDLHQEPSAVVIPEKLYREVLIHLERVADDNDRRRAETMSVLEKQFDALCARMKTESPALTASISAALGNADTLNQHYKPGRTEGSAQ